MASHAARFRTPVLGLAILSLCLNLAIVGTAGRTLHVFSTQHDAGTVGGSNAFFLPIWRAHFDTHAAATQVGLSATIAVLNIVLIAALFVAALPANLIVLVSSLASAALALAAIAVPARLNARAGMLSHDTVQTWTCMWRGVQGQGVPAEFGALCHESRFAFYTAIPSFVIQLLLLSAALQAVLTRQSSISRRMRRLSDDGEEKGQELDKHVQRQTYQTKR